MYSYEQRLRAVELYIQLGKRVGATMRQLGVNRKQSQTASRMTSGGNLWRLKETGCMRIPQSGGQFCPVTENAWS